MDLKLTEEEAAAVEQEVRELLAVSGDDQQAVMMAMRMSLAPGATKNIRGQQYVLNRNHRWQRQQGEQPQQRQPGQQQATGRPVAHPAPAKQAQQQKPAKRPPPVSKGAVNPQGNDTFEQHQKDGKWSPERAALHQKIVDSHFAGKSPVQNPVAYVLGGGPASGKSTIVNAGHVGMDDNTVHVDADAIKAMLPEYASMLEAKDDRAAAHVHEESSYIAKMIQAKGSQGSYHTLLDGTGDSSFESLAGKVSAMRKAGQRVVAHYVTVPTELAIQRNIERAKKTGRLPPEAMLRTCHSAVSRIVPEAIKQNLFDEFALWDTENGSVKVASGIDGKFQIHDEQLWKKFLAKGQENGS